MRRRLMAAFFTALIGVAPACGSDKRPGSTEKERPLTDAATAGAQSEPPHSVSNVPAPSAAHAPGGSAPVGDTSHAAATLPAAPNASTPPRTPRVNGPRRVMLGDLDLTGIGHDAGSATAPVVLIDFSDFGCPYCAQFTRETYPTIEREYVRTGKVFFKYVPFIVGMFPHAREATRAVECAAEQGLFWPMADHVYDAQRSWKGGEDPAPLFMEIAGVVGADTSKVSGCYRDGRTDARTARANDVAATIGVRVTPSFVVNDRPVQGALPLAEFRKVIEAALLVEAAKK